MYTFCIQIWKTSKKGCLQQKLKEKSTLAWKKHKEATH